MTDKTRRLVEHAFDSDTLTLLIESTSYTEAHKALAYLSLWSMDTYNCVTITMNAQSGHNEQMVACYFKPGSKGADYVIGMLWNGKTFVGHS